MVSGITLTDREVVMRDGFVTLRRDNVVTISEVEHFRVLFDRLEDDQFQTQWYDIQLTLTYHPVAGLLWDKFGREEKEHITSLGFTLNEDTFEKIQEFLWSGRPFGTDEHMSDIINRFLEMEENV
jgi:hypothetical protein